MQFNVAQLVQGAEMAWPSANRLLGVEFAKRITSDIWDWPRGESPRDIVDTQQLRDSYDGRAEEATVWRHTWATRYAMAVHEGAVIGEGGDRRTMPARPWTRRTLDEFDFAGAFAKIAAEMMRRQTGGL